MADQHMLGGVFSHEGVKTQKDLKGKSRLNSLSQVRMALADAESELLQAAYVLDEACSQGKTVKSDLVIPFAHMMGEQAQCLYKARKLLDDANENAGGANGKMTGRDGKGNGIE